MDFLSASNTDVIFFCSQQSSGRSIFFDCITKKKQKNKQLHSCKKSLSNFSGGFSSCSKLMTFIQLSVRNHYFSGPTASATSSTADNSFPSEHWGYVSKFMNFSNPFVSTLSHNDSKVQHNYCNELWSLRFNNSLLIESYVGDNLQFTKPQKHFQQGALIKVIALIIVPSCILKFWFLNKSLHGVNFAAVEQLCCSIILDNVSLADFIKIIMVNLPTYFRFLKDKVFLAL